MAALFRIQCLHLQHQQRQQIGFLHLSLALTLLFLTLTPHMFNFRHIHNTVSCLQFEPNDISHKFITNFDLLDSNDLKIKSTHTKRSVINDQTSRSKNQIKQVEFSSLGEKFNLILSKPRNLITDDFSVVKIDSTGNINSITAEHMDIRVLAGTVKGDPRSTVTATIDHYKGDLSDFLMNAHIKFNGEEYIVEPIYLHKDKLNDFNQSNINPNRTMIVYRLNDLDEISKNETLGVENYCEGVDIHLNSSATKHSQRSNIAESIGKDKNLSILEFAYPDDTRHGFIHEFRNKFKRSIYSADDIQPSVVKERTRCTLHLVVDYLFYKNIGNHDSLTTINYLLALIDRVNRIYMATEWETDEEDGKRFRQIGFTVQNISIHDTYTTTSTVDNLMHYNMKTDAFWDAREFLDNFSQNSPSKHYCLAHLLTYRQFKTPVLGLAYVASARQGAIGGICSPPQLSQNNKLFRHNSGISTSKGINGETLITRQADLVVAHELGHNLGAEHDSKTCRPSISLGGPYLMHPYAVLGFDPNNRFLSNCSKTAIARVLKSKANSCFVAPTEDVCGNGILEKGEECDAGGLGFLTEDECCNSNCKLKSGARCSDRHSWCCNKCQIAPAGLPCSRSEELRCKEASVCDGISPECPRPPPIANGTICLGRGVCFNGVCEPLCESNNLISCECTNNQDACKLCCKPTIDGVCKPFDPDAPHLSDGVSCYRGICEKGRCEPRVQDLVERLWDIIEDINHSTIIKFLRDNIAIVVLVLTMIVWLVYSHFFEKFDRQFKDEIRHALNTYPMPVTTGPPPSPFCPVLFVGDDGRRESYPKKEYLDETTNGVRNPEILRPPHRASQMPIDPQLHGHYHLANGNSSSQVYEFPDEQQIQSELPNDQIARDDGMNDEQDDHLSNLNYDRDGNLYSTRV